MKTVDSDEVRNLFRQLAEAFIADDQEKLSEIGKKLDLAGRLADKRREEIRHMARKRK